MTDTGNGKVPVNGSISRARPQVDAFTNVQLTCKKLSDAITSYKRACGLGGINTFRQQSVK